MAHGESNVIKSSAMNVLPFPLTDDAQNAINKFRSGEINWVDLTLEGETIHCIDTAVVEADEKLMGHVSNEDARYALAFCAHSVSLMFLDADSIYSARYLRHQRRCLSFLVLRTLLLGKK